MNDEYYMNLALELAKSARGQTSPNPLVGCVIVKDGSIVGMGAHLIAGGSHAEINALRMAQGNEVGSTVYVTLEPCNHYGRTPPCTEALINAKVKRVVIAQPFDPDPRVQGQGIQTLRQASIEVDVGVMQQEASQLNEWYEYFKKTQRPFVTLKTASTLDGKIATHTGHSQWVTGDKAREEVHQLRHHHDAILVGVGTVIADNPKLTTRLPSGEGRHPVRVILDSSLRIPDDATVINDGKAPVMIFTTENANVEKKERLTSMGCEVIVTGADSQVDLDQVLKVLAQKHITSVLVEGGSQINGAFLKQHLVNRVVTYIAPKILGGTDALTSFKGLEIEDMGQAFQLGQVTVSMVGNDIKVTGTPIYENKVHPNG
ncbi:bifunctional diaminohydroxyphosphoribosylaminopyrimidine deaminase/5-amino-6-(5-phosphoribosylamino)uracil reductase RibD [Caldalkalibacillus salinus]|uniref:bifunctional diaminohydroxyphosphoribosylaminopyrimidine deaminase/5-amino-6-(5-phosphoribosylamino)uracil reductase RibD n=1 Tax=Caldalkalibacillus salinus TaxID=2803787 RepID=UPI001920D68B|nr:bifunctional diaminohydroxyphosphoribosylaminopyrimidine deaminase/5-amino-6-(5-phosphoribosylamino)uracil reductase RibD [Caldalkalibacillus salinus]